MSDRDNLNGVNGKYIDCVDNKNSTSAHKSPDMEIEAKDTEIKPRKFDFFMQFVMRIMKSSSWSVLNDLLS